MPQYPKMKLAFNIGSTNGERIEAFELYHKAFGAVKIAESTPPDGDELHILMEINGFEILLAPGGKVQKVPENAVTCEMHFDREHDLHKAYDALAREGRNCSLEGPYPWATVLALVTDKFGVAWALYFHGESK